MVPHLADPRSASLLQNLPSGGNKELFEEMSDPLRETGGFKRRKINQRGGRVIKELQEYKTCLLSGCAVFHAKGRERRSTDKNKQTNTKQ